MSEHQDPLSERSRPRIVFLFSDTGGGHRSAAQAIIDALNQDYPNQVTCEMVDFFRQYAPPPVLDHMPELYPPLSRKPALLGAMFHLSNGIKRSSVFMDLMWPYVRDPLRRLMRGHPADLYISVHPLINNTLGRGLVKSGSKTPFMIVVTDLVTTHATWYWKRADLVIVPSEAAYQRGRKLGFPADRMRVVGLPVAERFCQPPGDRREIRARLGWPQDRPVALVVGGGEGMGPLEDIARAIDAACLPLAQVVIAGRNQPLRERLEAYPWQIPTLVYGFVQDMPDFMCAADFLVSKAGPGTISEALVAGLPIILYSRLAGPEEGNVPFVVKNHLGVWAPRTEQVVQALAHWLEHPQEREKVAQNCLSMARPGAAREIARCAIERFFAPGGTAAKGASSSGQRDPLPSPG